MQSPPPGQQQVVKRKQGQQQVVKRQQGQISVPQGPITNSQRQKLQNSKSPSQQMVKNQGQQTVLQYSLRTIKDVLQQIEDDKVKRIKEEINKVKPELKPYEFVKFLAGLNQLLTKKQQVTEELIQMVLRPVTDFEGKRQQKQTVVKDTANSLLTSDDYTFYEFLAIMEKLNELLKNQYQAHQRV